MEIVCVTALSSSPMGGGMILSLQKVRKETKQTVLVSEVTSLTSAVSPTQNLHII